MSWAYSNFFACKKAMEDVYKNYGLAKSKANKLKKWVCEEFEESRKYEAFIDSIISKDEIEMMEDIEKMFEELNA